LRSQKREAILTIPPVVGVIVVRIHPPTIIVAIHTEEVRVAALNARHPICTTTPRILSELYFICDHNRTEKRAKYLHF
jgi:hypothetical protein